MKKLIILSMLSVSLLFSQPVSNALGIGYPGLTYRIYNDNKSYVEFVGHLFLNKYEYQTALNYKAYLGYNYGKYLYVSNSDKINFAIKYRAGVALGHRYDSSTWLDNYNGYQIEGSLGIGIEAFNPLESGFSLDLFIGQEIVAYEKVGFSTHPVVNISALLSY